MTFSLTGELSFGSRDLPFVSIKFHPVMTNERLVIPS